LNIKGIGDCFIQFKDTKKKRLLKNALHVSELGINLVSQSKLVNNFTIGLPNLVLLVNNRTSDVLTEGKCINGLYYLPVRILKPKKPLLALLADSTSLNIEATASTTLVESTSSTLVDSTSFNIEEVTYF